MEKPKRKSRITKAKKETTETPETPKRKTPNAKKTTPKRINKPRKPTGTTSSKPRGRNPKKSPEKEMAIKKPSAKPSEKETRKQEPHDNGKNTSQESNVIPPVRIHQTVAILIDGNNIEMSIHSMLKKKKAMINFDILIPKLLKERGLNRLIYFREGKSISSKLAERLHNLFYGTVVPCHKSADIPLTIAATQIAEKVDTIIILSGDADYVELVKHLSSRGVRVEIAAVEQTTASILLNAADHFSPITREDCFVLN